MTEAQRRMAVVSLGSERSTCTLAMVTSSGDTDLFGPRASPTDNQSITCRPHEPKFSFDEGWRCIESRLNLFWYGDFLLYRADTTVRRNVVGRYLLVSLPLRAARRSLVYVLELAGIKCEGNGSLKRSGFSQGSRPQSHALEGTYLVGQRDIHHGTESSIYVAERIIHDRCIPSSVDLCHSTFDLVRAIKFRHALQERSVQLPRWLGAPENRYDQLNGAA